MKAFICTEHLCAATADKGERSRNLGSFLGPSTYIIRALHGSPGLRVTVFQRLGNIYENTDV